MGIPRPVADRRQRGDSLGTGGAICNGIKTGTGDEALIGGHPRLPGAQRRGTWGNQHCGGTISGARATRRCPPDYLAGLTLVTGVTPLP